VFLDGDATPLAMPPVVGWLLINPYRTTILRLALSSDWLIRKIYDSQCGPACPRLSAAEVETWRRPLQQPGFGSVIAHTRALVTVISTVSHPGVTSGGRKTLSMARAFSDDLLAQEPA
jgi:hypothetical protein